jgi:hypothetical protein
MLIETEIMEAIEWTEQRQNCTLVAINTQAVGTKTISWLRENGQIVEIGKLNDLVVIKYKTQKWIEDELKAKKLPSQGSRTPSNYVKW